MSKISVIVPVYNSENYLHHCIDSVLAQTFTKFELLLIDDGSKDCSGAICDEYAAKDSRVKVFHKENGGVSSAREIGVWHSSGEFVFFLDSDDAILPDAFESMLTFATDGIDMVVFDSCCNMVCTPIEYAKRLLCFQDWVVWGKLYKRSLFDNCIFDIPNCIKVGEDFLMNLRILKNVSGSIVCKPTHKYLYNIGNPASVQVSHKSSYNYEKMIVEYADKAISLLSADDSLNDKLFHWKLEYLGGVIGYRYHVIYSDAWIQSLIRESSIRQLSVWEYIIIYAASGCFWAKWVLYSHRFLKNKARMLKLKIRAS